MLADDRDAAEQRILHASLPTLLTEGASALGVPQRLGKKHRGVLIEPLFSVVLEHGGPRDGKCLSLPKPLLKDFHDRVAPRG